MGVRFKGRNYPAVNVSLKEYGERLVSVESLEDALFHEGTPVNKEALTVDSTIFFYVPDWLMDCSNRSIAAYVEEQVA